MEALSLRAKISFHRETVGQLHREFRAAVDDYVADCKAQGLPPEVHGAALVAAQASGKSLNQWATEILQEATQS